MAIINNPFRLITISGASGTGKSLLTKKLAKVLNWSVFSVSTRQRTNAQEYSLAANQIHKLPKNVHLSVDREMKVAILNDKNKILESRLCGWQARNYQDILRILCICDRATKVKRYQIREKISAKKARQEIVERDNNNLANFIKLYSAQDYLNPKYYQLVIDTSEQTPAQEVQKVIDFIESK